MIRSTYGVLLERLKYITRNQLVVGDIKADVFNAHYLHIMVYIFFNVETSVLKNKKNQHIL